MNDGNLRRVVRHILEAAVGGSQAAGQNLALYRGKDRDEVVYILYDPTALTTELLKWTEGSGNAANVIWGLIQMKPHPGECWGAAEVKYSAARKGYGPLMYELAMSDFKSGIMSDRNSTSIAARNVWQKYMQRADVQKKPLDDKNKPKTVPKVDDCRMIPDFDGEEAYLNHAYIGSGDASSKPTLMKNHADCITTLVDQTGKQQPQIEKIILEMGHEYFGARYNNG